MRFLDSKLAITILSYFTKGHERSIRAKKNILALFLIKGCSIAISLILVPLTINYVNPSRYGIWLTLSSIVAWFSFFDIGLTQGLRNKFAEAKAKNDNSLIQAYVSTTYALLSIIFFSTWILFLIANHFLNWSSILNVPDSMRGEVTTLALIVFTYFCLTFVIKIITTILIADQHPANAGFVDVLGQILSLIFVVILIKTTQGSLIKLGVALCLAPIIALFAANLFLYNGTYKNYRPIVSKVNFKYVKDLFHLGLIFFVIQVAAIIQFQTANIIIAQNFTTADVTSYNIVYKYFSILNMVFVIFLAPFWSASTEAYFKGDIAWIKNGIKKYNILNILLAASGLLMLIFSDAIYRFWLGAGKVNIIFALSLWGYIYINVTMFGGKYVSFLNGINALRIQFISSIISPLLYIVVALILIKYYHLGTKALFIASVLANFNGYLLAPLQYYQIVHKNRKGIWIR